jgi:ribosomal protein L7/L12
MDELALTRRIRRLEEQVALLSQQAGVPWDEPGSGVPPEIVDLVRRNKKIEAIKRYRELTGVGLAEAKDVIDGV